MNLIARILNQSSTAAEASQFAILISVLEITNLHLCRDTQQDANREKPIVKCKCFSFSANMPENLKLLGVKTS